MMDFFEHQEVARKKTGRLVILFMLAVVGIIVLTYVAVALFVLVVGAQSGGGGDAEELAAWLLNPLVILGVGAGVIGLVGLGSIYKMAALRSGGQAVAEMLGGKLLDPGVRTLDEKRVLNVVEEMAIASGTPVPRVYVMDNEAAINAFAAGWSPDDAVIGVTRGTVELLNRDELQGVVAHEFSHILNGDMRLNIRLIGLLHGILVIGLTGYGILRSIRYMSVGRSTRRDGKGGGGGIIVAILALGAALVVIGFVGSFFGKLIKAAVSRQREFLADASAVQFTRNPEGIGGALQKIGGLTNHAKLAAPKAEEASHMFFGAAVGFWLGMMSTHPPIEERIRRVLPQWDGEFPKVARLAPGPADRVEQLRARPPARRTGVEALPDILTGRGLAGAMLGAVGGGAGWGGAIGNPTQEQLAYAKRLLEAIPDDIEREVRNPFGARAVVFCLLLHDQADVREKQLRHLATATEPAEFELVRSMQATIGAIDVKARLSLIELCLPALRAMAKAQYAAFRASVDRLIEADERTTIFEWTLRRVVVHHLDRHFGLAKRPTTQFYAMARLGGELSVLLSLLAHAGHEDAESVRAAFDAAAGALGPLKLTIHPMRSINTRTLDAALDRIALLAPNYKKLVLHASALCVARDRVVTAAEAELLRAVADSLDVPAPPLLPGQPLELTAAT